MVVEEAQQILEIGLQFHIRAFEFFGQSYHFPCGFKDRLVTLSLPEIDIESAIRKPTSHNPAHRDSGSELLEGLHGHIYDIEDNCCSAGAADHKSRWSAPPVVKRAIIRAMLKVAALLLAAMTAHAAVKIEKTSYKGWPNCYRITNGEVELIVTGDIGPRIMRYAFVGGQNFFKEFPEGLGKSGETAWVARGGHRIWAAPEDAVRTYAPDNGPVHIEIKGDVLEATEPVEPLTGLEKQIVVKLSPQGTGVEVLHRIRNAGKQPLELAPWALTMMAQGGVGIHGFPPRGKHPEVLYPTNPLVMWAFSNLSDHRWRFTRKYLMLHQDPKNPEPQKLGSFNKNTWAAYALNSGLFIKRYDAQDSPRNYPDFGCSFETFTNADFLEMETLGPLQHLKPGASLQHVEHWTLHKDVRLRNFTDEELDRLVLPLVGAR